MIRIPLPAIIAAAAVIMLAAYLLASIPDEPISPVEIQQPINTADLNNQEMAALLFENASPILGDKSAPVTLVEFGDYQCHFCNVFFEQTEKSILADYVKTGRVSMLFKDYNIIGPDSVDASHGAHCAGAQNLFWEYHDALYSHWDGENTGWASQHNLESIADGIQKLDLEKWSYCMQAQPYAQRILASNADAHALGLTGTPAFFVVGPDTLTPIMGAKPYAVFADALDSALAP